MNYTCDSRSNNAAHWDSNYISRLETYPVRKLGGEDAELAFSLNYLLASIMQFRNTRVPDLFHYRRSSILIWKGTFRKGE